MVDMQRSSSTLYFDHKRAEKKKKKKKLNGGIGNLSKGQPVSSYTLTNFVHCTPFPQVRHGSIVNYFGVPKKAIVGFHGNCQVMRYWKEGNELTCAAGA